MARLSRRGSIADSYQVPSSSVATLVQEASGTTGSTTASTFTPTLPGAAAALNIILIGCCSDATVATPSGFAVVDSEVNVNGTYLFAMQAVGGETAFTCTPGATVHSSWWIAELSHMTLLPLATTSTNSGPGAGPFSTGSTGSTSGATDGMAVAVFGSSNFSGLARNVTAMSNSFVEHADTSSEGSSDIGIAVGLLQPAADGTFESAATYNDSISNCARIMAVFGPA